MIIYTFRKVFISSTFFLQNHILSYTKNLSEYKSDFLSAAQFRFIQPIDLQIDDSLKDDSIINDQIDKIRTYQTNVNNSRILLNEVDRMNQRIKYIFRNLLKSTADYLISPNSWFLFLWTMYRLYYLLGREQEDSNIFFKINCL